MNNELISTDPATRPTDDDLTEAFEWLRAQSLIEPITQRTSYLAGVMLYEVQTLRTFVNNVLIAEESAGELRQ